MKSMPVDELLASTRKAFNNLIATVIDCCVDFAVLAGDPKMAVTA
jgi:DNA repair exonuclease SbcCD nuclease subunit